MIVEQRTSTSKKSTAFIIVAFLFVSLTTFVLLFYYQKQLSFKKTVSELQLSNTGIATARQSKNIENEADFTQTPEDMVPDMGEKLETEEAINAVSLGELKHYSMKRGGRGEKIAEASVIKFIVLDKDSNPKTFNVIVQFTQTGEEKNLIPAVMYSAKRIHTNEVEDIKDKLFTEQEILEIFSYGSSWEMTPLTDYSQLDSSSVYYEYTHEFYGDSIQEVVNFLESGLTDKISLPLFIIGIGKGTFEQK